MRFRVLDASVRSESDEWIRLWESWEGREVFAHPAYGRLFADTTQRVLCAVGEGPGRTVLFPLILRPLAEEPWAVPGESRWDATSPYGFGGPYIWGDRVDDVEPFWKAYDEWCRSASVVSTFSRLSPFAEHLAALPEPAVEIGPNVVCSLEGGLDAVLARAKKSVRAQMRRAEREGVTVEVDQDGTRVDDFIEVYEHTMRRNQASARYFFPRAFYDDLISELPGSFVFFHALLEGRVVSSELVLVSRHNCYSLLAGTLSEAFRAKPNYAISHAIFAWGVENGKNTLVIGGGLTPGDSLYLHKRAFAPEGSVPFLVSCLTHDVEASDDLIRSRGGDIKETDESTDQPFFFPSYRAPSLGS